MSLRLACLIAAAVVILAFAPGLGGPFVLDDHVNLAPVWEWMQGSRSLASAAFDNQSGIGGRPLAYLTLMANAAIGGEAAGFKVFNLVLHLASAVALFLLLRRLLPRLAAINADWAALMLTAAWALHPLQVSTVLYVVQRMAILGALAQFAALICYVEARRAAASDPARARAWLFAGFPACIALGLLAKETAILAVPLAWVIEYFLGRDVPRTRDVRVFLTATGVFALAALVVFFGVLGHSITQPYLDRVFSLQDRLATEPVVLWNYLAAIMAPGLGHLGLYRDGFAVASPVASLVAVVAWIAIIVVAFVARRRHPLAAFGIAWFLVSHALESTVFPLELYFEHRNYVALVGPLLVAMDVLVSIFRVPALAARIGAGLVVLLTACTLVRAWHWRDLDAIYAAEGPPPGEVSRRLQVDRGIRAYEFGNREEIARELDVLRSGDAADRAGAALWSILFVCDDPSTIDEGKVADLRANPPPLATHNLISALQVLIRRQDEGRCPGLAAGVGRDTARQWLDQPRTAASGASRKRLMALIGEAK